MTRSFLSSAALAFFFVLPGFSVFFEFLACFATDPSIQHEPRRFESPRLVNCSSSEMRNVSRLLPVFFRQRRGRCGICKSVWPAADLIVPVRRINAFAAPRRHQLLIDGVVDVVAKEIAVAVTECDVHAAAVCARRPSIARNVGVRETSTASVPIEGFLIVDRISNGLSGDVAPEVSARPTRNRAVAQHCRTASRTPALRWLLLNRRSCEYSRRTSAWFRSRR